jgi:hypothetical protein
MRFKLARGVRSISTINDRQRARAVGIMERGEQFALALSELFPWLVGFLLVVLIVGFIQRIFSEEQMKLLDWFLLFLGLSIALFALR